ncbi:hypothetical protein GCM10027579_13510 [Calidifontibacter terrae]
MSRKTTFAVPPAALSQAKAYVTALVHTRGVPRQTWADAVAKYAVPGLRHSIDLTDPAQIPEQKVTGEPVVLSSSALGNTVVFVPTSARGWTLTLITGSGPVLVEASTPGRVTGGGGQ